MTSFENRPFKLNDFSYLPISKFTLQVFLFSETIFLIHSYIIFKFEITLISDKLN